MLYKQAIDITLLQATNLGTYNGGDRDWFVRGRCRFRFDCDNYGFIHGRDTADSEAPNTGLRQ